MSKNSARILVLSVAALVSIGMVMLFSASAYARDSHGDVYFFLKRQSAWLVIGMVACVLATLVDYHFWSRAWAPLFLVAAALLALCFVPHIGLRLNGSSRWVRLGPLVFQPSEIGKLAAIVALAWWFTKFEARSAQFLHGFVLPMMLIGVLMLLIVREEDLGTTLLIGATMVAVMFVAGSNPIYMTLLALAGFGGILFLATHMSERMARLDAFFDLERTKEGAGLQQWEALKALGSGGLWGLGLGESREKFQYLPYAHTDFIFPIIGEELGLRATLLIVLSFLLVTLSGTLIALQARDRFGMLLGFGLVANIALQASVNIGMTTALMPNKGMPLPFISAGGSNLCLCLLFVGVLLNIYRQGVPDEAGAVTNATGLQTRATPRL
jgi:cell division protein FtsW